MKLAALTLSCSLALGLIGCADSGGDPANSANFTEVNTATAKVDGMTCSACETAVRAAVKDMDGVKDVSADAKTGELKIALEEGAHLDTEAVKKAIADAGEFTVSTDVALPAGFCPLGCTKPCCAGEAKDKEETSPVKEDDTQASADADATYFVAEYQVEGMSCAACSGAVSTALSKLDGVESCDADFSTGKVHVKVADGTQLQIDQVAAAVKAAGFTLVQ